MKIYQGTLDGRFHVHGSWTSADDISFIWCKLKVRWLMWCPYSFSLKWTIFVLQTVSPLWTTDSDIGKGWTMISILGIMFWIRGPGRYGRKPRYDELSWWRYTVSSTTSYFYVNILYNILIISDHLPIAIESFFMSHTSESSEMTHF